ncbi:hypothetical protein [uncultured Thiodictyon sp.]|uniref:hypothetical protein n=1 Tax=uncultured Thiodictyon sp. TaxID=1846217 RepID=UPI0025E82EF0|nr:hypothetical protein [uncultured Thiodictyon sp.]
MSKPIERRIEALEQSTPIQYKPDFSGLTREERAECRIILESIGDGRMTPEEARARVAQLGSGPRRLCAEDQATA